VLWLLLFVVLCLALAWRKDDLKTTSIAFGAFAVIYLMFGGSFGHFLILAVVLAAILVPLNLPSMRQEWLTRPALGYFRKVLPPLSDSERIALEAGTVSWDAQLFSGAPQWNRLRAIPEARLSPEEQAFLEGPVVELCEMCDDWRITTIDRDLSPQTWAFIKDKGFFGLIIPKRYGGHEFSAQAHSAILHRIASGPGGVTAASIVAVPNSLGPAELLLHYGTERQKEYYLPRLARGEEVPCFALTSPWAGSDAGSLPDTGVVCTQIIDGKETLGIRLRFDKRYITLAPVATVVGLAFRLFDPEHLLGEVEDVGITCALIPRDTPGLEIGHRHWPIESPFMNGPVRGHDVFIAMDCLIGGTEYAGQGWRMLMECLSMGRGISLPSASAGGATLASFTSGAYARIREQFGIPVGKFEGVQEALATVGGLTYGANALRQLSAALVDQGERPSVPSAIAKLHGTAMAREAGTAAMDIHAGKAVVIGPSNYLARHYEGAPVAITVEGANILTRSMIVYGQGAIRCHPYVLQEMEAAHDPDSAAGLDAFDRALWGHVGHILSCLSRSLVLGLTNGRMAQPTVASAASRHAQRVDRYSAALALMSDAAMALLGGKLKFKESISARLGDVLAQLMIVSAAIKRFETDGTHQEDEVLLEWIACRAFVEIEKAIDGVLCNLDNRPAAWVLRFFIFPFGRRARPASDKVVRDIAQLMQTPSRARKRLTAGQFLPQSLDHPTALLQTGLEAVVDTDGLRSRLKDLTRQGLLTELHPSRKIDEAHEKGYLTEDEFDKLSTAQRLIERIIHVDEFEPEAMKPGQTPMPVPFAH